MSIECEDVVRVVMENCLILILVYKIVFMLLLVVVFVVVVDCFVIILVFLKRIYFGDVREINLRYDVVDEEVVSLFVIYDENLDGFVDLLEFVKVVNRILY